MPTFHEVDTLVDHVRRSLKTKGYDVEVSATQQVSARNSVIRLHFPAWGIEILVSARNFHLEYLKEQVLTTLVDIGYLSTKTALERLLNEDLV